MLQRVIALLCLLVNFSVTASAKYEYLLNRSYASRHRDIDSLFYYNKTLRLNKSAFFAEVRILADEAKNAGDIELECEAKLLSIAYNSASAEGDFSKVEPEVFELINVAQKNNLPQIELRCKQFLGRYYMEKVGKYIESIDEFLSSYYILQKLTVEEFPTKKEHIYNIAHAYYNFGDISSAKKYMTEAEQVKMPNNATMLDDKNKVHTYINLENTLGLIYRNERKFDSAIHYFKTVQELAQNVNDSIWIGIATGNIGISYYLQGKYDLAVPLLQEDIYQSLKGEQWDNGVNSLIKLADIHLHKRNWQVVKLLMDSARNIISRCQEPSQHMQYLCPVMAKYYAATGHDKLAYLYMDSARMAKDEMDSKKNAMVLSNEQHKLELQQHRAEMQKAEDDKQLQLLKRNSLLAGVLLIAGLTIVIINGQKRAYSQRTKLAEAERLRAEQDLQNARSQLKDFTDSIHEKNALIESISAEIEKYQSANDVSAFYGKNDILIQLQQSILLTEYQWEQFKINFEKVHTGFLTRLREKLPDLTPAEIRYMALAKLKLSNKEMAAMLGVSVQGVRNYRYRLRKKVNLPEEGDIDDLVNMI